MSDHDARGANEQEQILAGGNMGGAVRVGVSVRRCAGAWSPTIQRLLRHLRQHGLYWVPEPLGRDQDGRDSVSYLAGEVPQYPLPDWIWSEDILADAARRLAQLHAASAEFDTTDASWQIPVHEPVEVICHNDFAPYNMVFVDGRLTGVIDWDTASPGPRVWDLAYLAYRLVPLTDPANGDGLDSNVSQRARRLRLLCDAYSRDHGHEVGPAAVLPATVQRLHDLAHFTQARADGGQDELRSHVDLYRRDTAWISVHTRALNDNAG
ncbi:trifolitoxin immunity domain-containing protein [Virgisporangium aliadipatigenens]|uniref:Trifolitoxin immunity domain-containing protein n=1 Tax=Virgisporangium aliadipatigenens TaxID=741659 RepID=A0A8J3YVF0_9ACTN|nr:aminoglycoside phosphotransferase family protein [Virgisporangium aliadipatigenens]GIJ51392.1 trifolitoxin immunity domain-containing protein [Virgisporangium aliadipatigenens]